MIGELTFPNETEYNKARDIYLELLERDDALPKEPNLTMLIREEYIAEMKERVKEAAIEHEETNRLT